VNGNYPPQRPPRPKRTLLSYLSLIGMGIAMFFAGIQGIFVRWYYASGFNHIFLTRHKILSRNPDVKEINLEDDINSSPKNDKNPRRFIYGTTAFLVTTLVVMLLQGPIICWVVEKGITKVEDKISQPISANIESPFPGYVSITDLTIGESSTPLLIIENLTVQINYLSLFKGAVDLNEVNISGLIVQVQSNGSIKGLATWARDLLPKSKDTTAAETTVKKQFNIPNVYADNIQIIDADDVLSFQSENISITDDYLHATGSIHGTTCQIEGPLTEANVVCEERVWVPITSKITGGLKDAFIKLKAEAASSIGVTSFQLASSEKTIHSAVQTLSFDLEIEPTKDSFGRYPVQFTLYSTNGGSSQGTALISSKVFRADFTSTGMQIDAPDQGVSFQMDGKYQVITNLVDKKIEMDLNGTLKNLFINHLRLASGPVGPMDLEAIGFMKIKIHDLDEKIITVNIPEGIVGLGRVHANYSLFYTNIPEKREMKLLFDTGEVDASLAVKAIPNGLMPHILPLEAKGPFRLQIHLEFKEPDFDKLICDISPQLDDVEVLSMNEHINFEKLNKIFYTHFTGKKKRKTGPSSGRWVRLASMPILLPYILMGHEDSKFMSHNGVRPGPLRESLVTNLKNGRFRRGGSTITMQLARNLFLSPEKTLARKLEEFFITWQIERYFTRKYKKYSGKRRLIEIYLNIVEFGPGVYGIGHAARHFFGKKPMELNLYEMMWIIKRLPKPKLGRAPKQVSEGMAKGMNVIMNKIHKKGLIPTEAYIPIVPGPWPSFIGEWENVNPKWSPYSRKPFFLTPEEIEQKQLELELKNAEKEQKTD
jgi:hypothetical protein